MNMRHSSVGAALVVLFGASAAGALPARQATGPNGETVASLVVPIAQRASCRAMGRMRSIESQTSVTVTFRNRSGEFRSVNWVDFDGQLVQYAALNPGQSFTIQTFLTHPWVFTDGPGNCVETYLPERGRSAFTLRKRSSGAGGD